MNLDEMTDEQIVDAAMDGEYSDARCVWLSRRCLDLTATAYQNNTNCCCFGR